MIDRDHKLPIKRQAKLLDISRGTVYYQPRPISPSNQRLMNRIDRLHLELPFAGARMLRDLLLLEGHRVGRSKVSRFMRLMGIEALYRKPKTTRRNSEHKVYPYLLRNLPVTRCNQVWAMDITYIPMARGFVYLAAVVDWHSRRVLSWKVSTTMDVHFCIEAVEEAMERFGKPDIFNTDQGSQFTSQAFTGLLKDNGIRISMDGKGAWRDNVFVERLWRSVKYEEVYLHAYDTVSAAKAGLDRYFRFYNSRRPHSSLDRQTPDQFYFDTLPLPMAA
jgi:putative transposase